ncbi:hypothetical protein [Novosphingobium rosa]|uniref:hypothetical protein n=1 Tax=Novosphingobium rosa TaxID=76978 RepID=UPI00082D8C72|nr:hypothetical protein [Novosphingobium rosa]
MTQVFYHVEGGEPLEFCRDMKVRRNAKMSEFADYSEAKGGIGYVDSWGRFGAIVFEEGAPVPTGLRAEKRLTKDGRVYYRPSKKTASGRALLAEFDALGRLPMSDEFATHFGIPTSLSYRQSEKCYGNMALHSGGFSTAQVLWVYDDFWVILPDIAAIIDEKSAAGFTCDPASFTVPAGLTRSTEARYELAMAAAKVREEEAADG